MPRDLAGPELAADQLAVRRQVAGRERLLVLLRVAAEHLRRRPLHVGDDDVHLAAGGFFDPRHRVGGGEAEHAAAFGQQVGDQDDRPLHLRQRLGDAADEEDRHQAGVEAAGADDHGVELGDRLRHRRMNRHRRLEPDPAHEPARRLPRIHFHLAARRRAVAVFRAHRRLLHADRPHPAAAAEQRAQPVDGVEKIAAVALHHRQQQVAAGVAAELGVLERRQARQQHAPRFAGVARQRQRALQDVAGRQHAELVAQLSGAAAAVEHRDDGVEVQPRVLLQAAEQARQSGAAAEAADVQLAQTHRGHCSPSVPWLVGRRTGSAADR